MQQPPSRGVGGTGDPYASQSPSVQSQQSQATSVGGATNELKADAQKLGSKTADRLHSEVDARKGTAVSQARTVSSALEQTAGQLDDGSPEWLRSAFRQGAQQIQRFAESIEQKDSRQLMNDVQGFARERPGMFLAACAAAGFAAARIFRAGEDQSPGQRSSSSPRAPFVEPADGNSSIESMSAPNSRGEFV